MIIIASFLFVFLISLLDVLLLYYNSTISHTASSIPNSIYISVFLLPEVVFRFFIIIDWRLDGFKCSVISLIANRRFFWLLNLLQFGCWVIERITILIIIRVPVKISLIFEICKEHQRLLIFYAVEQLKRCKWKFVFIRTFALFPPALAIELICLLIFFHSRNLNDLITSRKAPLFLHIPQFLLS